MRKLVFGVVALATLATAPALAADLRVRPAPVYKSAPVTPYYSWTGCYVGGNVGGAYSYKSFNDATGFYAPGFAGQDLGWHSAAGFAGGAQVGCDYQIGSWVIGAQGMFDWSNLKGNNQQPAGTLINQTSIPWMTTATGRLGYTVLPNLLLYVKGGGAWVKDNYTGYDPVNGIQASASLTRSGWTVGAGYEQLFAGGWSWFAEYNYLNFGTHSATFNQIAPVAFQYPINVQQDMHMILVGVNYRFGPGARY
jgi:outer membrane immunogenic protein